MKLNVLAVFIIAMIFSSCNKKNLPPKEEEPAPVFYFKCMANEFPVSIDAGVSGYYMTSSYFQDSSSIYVFKGELKQKNCSANCGFGITVLINDYKVSPSGNMVIDSTLSLSSYQYNDGNIEPLFYIGNFVPRQNSTQNLSYKWQFSDGNMFYTTSCTKTLKAHSKYTCNLETTSSLFGNIAHSNVFDIGNPVQTNVSATRIAPFSAFYYKFSALNPTGVAPYNYLWEFGDGYTSSDVSPSHEYIISNYYTAKLTLIDSNKDTCISYYQVPVVDGLFGESNFSAYFSPIQNPKALSAVTILVSDPSGNIYSSSSQNQAQNSHFQIVSIENYSAPESSQIFKKIKIKFNCKVYNGSNVLDITNGEAVIAIAYKN
ncbi:MAG: PKD domain-containing protein [Bacteroidota bacterium]|nr:PKD domain-containing protein [Bacteroidota bacterium]MDP3145250.1 PKD domain-containing protein [Bacteroidota bacterium]MDP3556919.1 PKD domain-containing protein [Bacteroidota bacterium]